MNPFSFKGRAKRSEYWAICFPVVILSRMSYLIPDSAFENPVVSLGILVASILMFWIAIATCTRRCHDLGHNGFWQLIPFYGIWMGFVEGEEGENEYNLAPGIVAQ